MGKREREDEWMGEIYCGEKEPLEALSLMDDGSGGIMFPHGERLSVWTCLETRNGPSPSTRS